LFIISFSKLKYNSEERKTNVFEPVLYPLYTQLMEKLKKTGLFALGNNMGMPEHRKIDRFFWGSQLNGNNIATILEDPLDAIEVNNLRLIQFNRQIC